MIKDKCPYCSGKLIHGYIKTRGEAITWSENPDKLSVMTNLWHAGEDDTKLGDFSYFKGDRIDAYKCNECNIIIIDANKEPKQEEN